MPEEDPLDGLFEKLDEETLTEPAESRPNVDLPAGAFLPWHRAAVAFFTLDKALQEWVEGWLVKLLREEDYRYTFDPPLGDATDARVIIMDVRPKTDMVLHGRYDQIVRVKKGKGQFKDTLIAIGPRKLYPRYPRGTYQDLLFFCVHPQGFDHRDPELPLGGLPTQDGPTLYNLADLPTVLREVLESPLEE